MLGVLGGAGWAAIKYTPALDIALKHIEEWQRARADDSSGGSDETQQIRDVSMAALGGDAPPFAGNGATASGDAPPFEPSPTVAADASSGPWVPAKDVPYPIQPASGASPIGGAPATSSNGGSPDDGELYPTRQTGYERSVAPSRPAAESTGDTLSDLDAELSRLGAVYTLLERWGKDRARYRFHCKVAVAGSEDARRFEAVGDDPTQVVREVIGQIAAWRAERGP